MTTDEIETLKESQLQSIAEAMDAYARTHQMPTGLRWKLYEAELAFEAGQELTPAKDAPDREGEPDPANIVNPDKEAAKHRVGKDRDEKIKNLIASHGAESAEVRTELKDFEKDAAATIKRTSSELGAKGLAGFLDFHGFGSGPALRNGQHNVHSKFGKPENYGAAETEAKKIESGWDVLAKKSFKSPKAMKTSDGDVTAGRDEYDLTLFRTPKGYAFKVWHTVHGPGEKKTLWDGRYFLRDGFDVYGKVFARSGEKAELSNALTRADKKAEVDS